MLLLNQPVSLNQQVFSFITHTKKKKNLKIPSVKHKSYFNMQQVLLIVYIEL